MSVSLIEIFELNHNVTCLDMESDSIPKIDLVVDHRPVGQFGLARFDEAQENTDYSESDSEPEDTVTSEGAPVDEKVSQATPKRRSARIQLTNKAGDMHKRVRYA